MPPNTTPPSKDGNIPIFSGLVCLLASAFWLAPNVSKQWQKGASETGHRIMVVRALGVGKAAVRFPPGPNVKYGCKYTNFDNSRCCLGVVCGGNGGLMGRVVAQRSG